MNILILGATSAIARSIMRLYAIDPNHHFFLVARNAERLSTVAEDLRVRRVAALNSKVLDLNQADEHFRLIEEVKREFGRIDLALIAYGDLGEETKAHHSFEEAAKIINTNFTSVVSLLTLLADVLEQQASGTIAVISSVAGDRGRQSNYVYGAAKGGLTIFMQGLRHRLSLTGVSALTIKAGFIDTPMTRNFTKGPLWSTPDKVAKAIVRAIANKSNTAYVPWFWRWIMLVIKLVPENIFVKTKL